MAVNLRSVTGELHQKLKVRAVQESVTIESLCVRFLWWGLQHMDQVSGGSSLVEQADVHPSETGSSPVPRSKPDMAALRAICAGMVAPELTSLGRQIAKDRFIVARTEVAICGKTWWEDGEHWECLMDAGHKESNHGLRGLVRRLDS